MFYVYVETENPILWLRDYLQNIPHFKVGNVSLNYLIRVHFKIGQATRVYVNISIQRMKKLLFITSL